MSYNLLDEKWIPVIWRCGKPEKVGIRDALTKAWEIREIHGPSPLDTVALYRFFLAFLQWCKPEPTEEETAAVRRSYGFPPEWFSDQAPKARGESADRFELVGEDNSFYQLDTSAPPKTGATALIHELPSGTNVAHFRHVRDMRDGLCPGCCAVGLTRLPAFTTSKGSGNYPGINQVPPMYVMPVGKTLLETLLRNWPMRTAADDHPNWDSGKAAPKANAEVGPLEGFTWLPRQVQLGPQDPAGGCCAWCGERTQGIRRKMTRLKPAKTEVEPLKARVLRGKWRDPHVGYLKMPAKSKTGEGVDTGALKAPDALDEHLGDNGFWRQIWDLLLSQSKPDGYVGPPSSTAKAFVSAEVADIVTAKVVSFATVKNDKYLDAWAKSLHLPVSVLREPERGAIIQAQLAWLGDVVHAALDPRTGSWKQPVGKLAGAALLRCLTPRADRKCHNLRAALASLNGQAESEFEQNFRAFIRDVASTEQGKLQDTAKAFRQRAHGILLRYLREAATSTASGSPLRRREMARRVEWALEQALSQVEEKAPRKDARPPEPAQQQSTTPERRKGKRGEA